MDSEKAVKNSIRTLEVRTNNGKPLLKLRRRLNKIIKGGDAKALARLHRDIMGKWEPVFCDEQYSSGDGFMTYTWGPAVWHFLHITSLNYRPVMQNEYKNMLKYVGRTLPCGHCRRNFDKNMEQAETDFKRSVWASQNTSNPYENRESFSRFVWHLHHCVNTMLDKDMSCEPTYEKMRDDLEQFRARCVTKEDLVKATMQAKEGGCTAALHKAHSKPRLQLVFRPKEEEPDAMWIDPKCVVKKQ